MGGNYHGEDVDDNTTLNESLLGVGSPEVATNDQKEMDPFEEMADDMEICATVVAEKLGEENPLALKIRALAKAMSDLSEPEMEQIEAIMQEKAKEVEATLQASMEEIPDANI